MSLRYFNKRATFMDDLRAFSVEKKREEDDEKGREEPRKWTAGDVVHGAIGAALGAGFAKGVSTILGVSPRFADKLETIAMGVGAAMNTGIIKRSKEELQKAAGSIQQMRKHAFRLGFMMAAYRTGLFKKAALIPTPFVNLDPAGLLSIPRHMAGAVTGAGRAAGAAVGAAEGADEDEEDIARMQVEKALLQEQLERLQLDHRNATLKKILANRKK